MTRTLITGAGRGLGLELTRRALERGHTVAATVRSLTGAAELRTLDPTGRRLAVVELDVADAVSVAEGVPSAVAALGGLDLLINCAGVNAMSFPEGRSTVGIETLRAGPMLGIFVVNTVGPLLVTQAALPALRASHRPRVVNISSWLGSIVETRANGNYAYGASKAALNMATRALANEVRADGIVAVAVNPGWVQTDMGGPRAELSAERSANGILDVADTLALTDSGRFLQWDGSEHAW